MAAGIQAASTCSKHLQGSGFQGIWFAQLRVHAKASKVSSTALRLYPTPPGTLAVVLAASG